MSAALWNTRDAFAHAIYEKAWTPEQLDKALKDVPGEIRGTLIAIANQHIFGKRSGNLEYWKRCALKQHEIEPKRLAFRRAVMVSLYLGGHAKMDVVPSEREAIPDLWLQFELARAKNGRRAEDNRAREQVMKIYGTVMLKPSESPRAPRAAKGRKGRKVA